MNKGRPRERFSEKLHFGVIDVFSSAPGRWGEGGGGQTRTIGRRICCRGNFKGCCCSWCSDAGIRKRRGCSSSSSSSSLVVMMMTTRKASAATITTLPPPYFFVFFFFFFVAFFFGSSRSNVPYALQKGTTTGHRRWCWCCSSECNAELHSRQFGGGGDYRPRPS